MTRKNTSSRTKPAPKVAKNTEKNVAAVAKVAKTVKAAKPAKPATPVVPAKAAKIAKTAAKAAVVAKAAPAKAAPVKAEPSKPLDPKSTAVKAPPPKAVEQKVVKRTIRAPMSSKSSGKAELVVPTPAQMLASRPATVMAQVVSSGPSASIEEITVEELSGEEQLINIGREKGYVTYEDILGFFPDAEKNLDQLEDLFAALTDAGIAIVASEDEGAEQLIDDDDDEDDEWNERNNENLLEAIEADDTVGLYLKEIGRVALLTAPQEVDLAQRMERGREAREHLLSGEKIVAKDKERMDSLIDDGMAAREHLINANSRLVISVAKKYIGRGVPFLDLIQEGNIGLIRAAKKFDWRRGHKFSTYATWWIRQAVTRAIADQGRTIRVPVHMGDQINRLLRASHQLTQELGRDPTVAELAESLNVTVRKAEQMIQVARRPISLETPTDDEEESVLGDFIPDDDSPAPAEMVTSQVLREQLAEILDTLPPREVRILQLRYGLLDGETYTLEEVGRKLGVTRERVRQIEAQALSRLRLPAHARKLRDFLRE